VPRLDGDDDDDDDDDDNDDDNDNDNDDDDDVGTCDITAGYEPVVTTKRGCRCAHIPVLLPTSPDLHRRAPTSTDE
jgi:hypothetical protein